MHRTPIFSRWIFLCVFTGLALVHTAQGIPRREWGTYVGGRSSDDFRDLTIDAQGNVYAVGATGSTTNISTPGMHQTTFAGNLDVMIVKFNKNGDRLWGAYLGGPDFDFGQSIAVDSKGNVFVGGGTRSTTNIATPGTFQSAFAGGTHDGFLAKFTNDGTLAWCTYVGGSQGEESINSISINSRDQICIGGWTESANNIATSGAQQFVSGGRSDAFLMKFDNDGTRLWGTFLGDAGQDLALQVVADHSDNIVISGWSTSTSNFATPGALQTVYAGGTADAYIAKYTSDGTLLWNTYIGGPQEEYGDALTLDKNNFIYLGGPCSSTSGLATPGAHQMSIGGDFDGYLIKLTPDGRKVWGTYLGGFNNDAVYGISIDQNLNVYATGYTDSPNGISTPDGYQPSFNGGGNDAMMAKFSSNGIRTWGTYYGGSGNDASFGIEVDQTQHIYIAGNTSSTDEISSEGSHQQSFGGSLSDALLVKFAPCTTPEATIPGRTLCTNDAIFDTIVPIGLPPYTLYMTIDGNASQVLYFKDSFIIVAIFGTQWNDSIRVDSIKSVDCLGILKGNTLYKTEKTLSYSPLQINCNQNNFTYTVSFTTNGINATLIASPQFRVIGDRIESNPIPFNQNYSVKFSHPAGCDTITLSGESGCIGVCPPINTEIRPLTPACIGDTVKIIASGRRNYFWSGPSGFISTVQNPTLIINSINQSGNYHLITTDSMGCADTLMTNLIINLPAPITTSNNGPQCINGIIQLSTSLANKYVWTGPNNFESTLQNPILKNINTLFTGRYRVTSTDQNGCKSTDSTDIVVETISKTMISGRDTICQFESTELKANGSGSFIWDNGENTASIIISPKQSTTFKVIRTEGACKDTAQIFIAIKPVPKVILEGVSTIYKGKSISLKASGAKTYTWQPSAGLSCSTCDQPITTPMQDVTYCVTGNENGCADTACISVTVKPECKLFIPNIFTPNDDQINDQWCITGGCYQINMVQVFNRWGALVWKSTDNNPCWDGKDLKLRVIPGIYVYVINAIDENGIKVNRSGDLTLIK